jgi:hypothetical protein
VPVLGRHPNDINEEPGKVDRPIATVPVGTRVKTDRDVEGWTFFVSNSPGVPRMGYILTSRLNPIDQPGVPPRPAPASPDTRVGKSAPAVCLSLAKIYNSGAKPDPWPEKRLKGVKLPDAARAEAAADDEIEVYEVRIGNQTLEEVTFPDDNSTRYEPRSFLTLWSPDFKRKIPDESDQSHFMSQLVSVSGEPVLIDAGSSMNQINVATFSADLALNSACTLNLTHFEHEERVESATEPAVCAAALEAQVSNISFSAIAPYRSSAKEFTDITTLDHGYQEQFAIIGSADVDLDDTGTAQRLGWAAWDALPEYHYPSTGHFEWPVLLTAAGKLPADPTWSAAAFTHAAPDSMARLFRFKHATYVEYHWGPHSDEHTHAIWHLTSKGQERACQFTTGQSSRYEVIRQDD